MTLWDYMEFQSIGYLDIDTYDTVFDTVVTVCADKDMENSDDPYDQFIVALAKHIIMEDSETCHWADFVEENLDKFRSFAEEHWVSVPEDNEDLMYEWVRELHYYLAGYTSESIYKAFIEEVLE